MDASPQSALTTREPVVSVEVSHPCGIVLAAGLLLWHPVLNGARALLGLPNDEPCGSGALAALRIPETLIEHRVRCSAWFEGASGVRSPVAVPHVQPLAPTHRASTREGQPRQHP